MLAGDVPSSSISAANAEVKRMQSKQQNTSKSKRELYAKFTDVQKAEIAKRAVEHGIASTIHYFAMQHPGLKESRARTQKNAYCTEIKRKRSIGSSDLRSIWS